MPAQVNSTIKTRVKAHSTVRLSANTRWSANAPSWSPTPFPKRRFLKANKRSYVFSVGQAFRAATDSYPSIAVNDDVMMGAPCISGTRIPVYMVLDAVEHHGDLEGAIRSYPRLSLDQVKDAIGFAKLVIECPLDDETAPAS